jgi:hypothetical protein
MKVELRGTISAALGTAALDVQVPESGVPLSRLLESLARANPRASKYLQPGPAGAVLRAVHNGNVVPPSDDPLVLPDDSLLLLHAVAGGSQSG